MGKRMPNLSYPMATKMLCSTCVPCDDSAGENVWWIVHKLNGGHARRILNEDNYARKAGRMKEVNQNAFGTPVHREILLVGSSRNLKTIACNAGTESYESIPWSEIDVERAKLRFIYNNAGGSGRSPVLP